MTAKSVGVVFCNKKLEEAYELLTQGRFEDKQLYSFINRAIDEFKKNPDCGTRIQKDLWPKEYIQKYNINNLRKYDLPNGWRLVYTLKANEVEILSIILEWFDHKKYEQKFKY